MRVRRDLGVRRSGPVHAEALARDERSEPQPRWPDPRQLAPEGAARVSLVPQGTTVTASEPRAPFDFMFPRAGHGRPARVFMPPGRHNLHFMVDADTALSVEFQRSLQRGHRL